MAGAVSYPAYTLDLIRNMPNFKPVYEGTPPLLTSLFVGSPRDESLLDMYHYTFFPYFYLQSLTFIWIVLIVFVFCYGFWNESILKSEELLQTNQRTLFILGECSPHHIINQHQYFRLLTSLVLFRNLHHLLLTILAALVTCSYVQHLIGWKKAFLLIVLTAVAGEMIAIILQKRVTIEGSTPVCALIGYLLGINVLLWKKWEKYSSERFHMLVFLVVATALCLLSGHYYNNISNLSHISAIVYGFIFSLLENPQTEDSRCSRPVKILSLLFVVGSVTMAAISLLFWTYTDQLTLR